QSVAVGQAHVGEHEIEWLGADALPCFGQIGGGQGFEAGLREAQRQQIADVRFVIDDQNAVLSHVNQFLLRAKLRRKRVPPSGRLPASSRAPLAWAKSRAM